MSSTLIVPPNMLQYGKQEAATQQFYQRQLFPEVLRFDLDNLAATGIVQLVRVPFKRAQVIGVRTYAYAAGSGQYTVDVLWLDSGGASHSVFAVAGDRVTSLTASPRMVEKVATGEVLVDPLETSLEGRFYCNVTAFAGTAWTAVVVDVMLNPISRG